MKEDVGNELCRDDIFMKAMIPVTTTMTVSVKGILRDSFTFASFPCRLPHKMPFWAEFPQSEILRFILQAQIMLQTNIVSYFQHIHNLEPR
jgi:hypothetical protein